MTMEGAGERAPDESGLSVLRAAVSVARPLLDPQATFAALAGPRGHTIVASDDLDDPRWSRVVVRAGRGLGGRVLQESQPIAIEDYASDSSITGDYRPIVNAEGLRAMICVPIEVANRVDGLLYIAPRESGRPEGRMIDFARQIAKMAQICLLETQARSLLTAGARRALRRGDVAGLRAVVERVGEQPVPAPAPPELTKRQLEVLDLLAGGASNAEIAARLFISEATAKEHVRNLCARLEARSRLQAVARAGEAGLV